jgi:hypothetical protein
MAFFVVRYDRIYTFLQNLQFIPVKPQLGKKLFAWQYFDMIFVLKKPNKTTYHENNCQ